MRYDEDLYAEAADAIDVAVQRGKPFGSLPQIASKLSTKKRVVGVQTLRKTISNGRVDPDNLDPIVAYAHVEEFEGYVWTTELFHPDEAIKGWQGHGSRISERIADKQNAGVELLNDGLAAAQRNDDNAGSRRIMARGSKNLDQLKAARKQHGLSTPTQKQLTAAKKKAA